MEPVNEKGFFFFKNYWEVVNLLAKTDKELAKEVCWAIINYAMIGEYDESDSRVDSYMVQFKPGIDAALKRTKRAEAGGKAAASKLKVDEEKVLALIAQGYKQKEVAQKIGCSDRTIRRVLERNRMQK